MIDRLQHMTCLCCEFVHSIAMLYHCEVVHKLSEFCRVSLPRLWMQDVSDVSLASPNSLSAIQIRSFDSLLVRCSPQDDDSCNSEGYKIRIYEKT